MTTSKRLVLVGAVYLMSLVPAGAETLPGSSLAIKFVTTNACDNNNCAGAGSGTFRAVHRFEVDEAILAQIDNTTSITINVVGVKVPLIVSDDPQFANGATSAKMARRVSFVSYVIGTADVTALAVWTGGVFTVSVQGRFTGYPVAGPGIAPAFTKELEQINLQTVIEKPGMLLNKTSALLPLDFKQRYRDFRAADGDMRFDTQYEMRTPK